MKQFYLIPFLFLTFSAFLFTGCSDDDSSTCTPPTDLASNLIGVWNLYDTTVEFKADGTLIDEDGYLISGSLQGEELTYRSYVVDSETQITISIANAANDLSIYQESTVSKNDCDEINLVFSGSFIDVLTR